MGARGIDVSLKSTASAINPWHSIPTRGRNGGFSRDTFEALLSEHEAESMSCREKSCKRGLGYQVSL